MEKSATKVYIVDDELKSNLFSTYHVSEEDLTQDKKLMSGFSGEENYSNLIYNRFYR